LYGISHTPLSFTVKQKLKIMMSDVVGESSEPPFAEWQALQPAEWGILPELMQ
jgi:hypothetical protein